MIGTIAKREFLEYMKSMKFLIGLLVTLALVTISTLINVNDFRIRQQDFVSAGQEMKGNIFNIRNYRPPQALSTLVQGKDRTLGSRHEMTYLRIEPRTTGYMGESASQHHRYVAGFSLIDYAFVVRIILSLMVLFLIYNAVSGEKEAGTLRLVYANPVGRHALLVGKFVGGLTTVILALLVATAVSLLIIIFSRAVTLTGADWIRIMCLFGISALYLMCFFTLGLFVSVVADRPSIALTILLQVWIFVNIIYPNLSAVLAENSYSLPSEEEIIQRKKAAFQPYETEYKIVYEQFSNEVNTVGHASKDIQLRQIDLAVKKAELEYAVDLDYSRQQTRQMQIAKTLSILSPAALYDETASRFAGTGMENFERFMGAILRHWREFTAWHRTFVVHLGERQPGGPPPVFSFTPEEASGSFSAAVPQVLLLVLFSVIFFMLAYTSFLKKDVR
jgi:ABC-type transport system involved in multi-copper enzyme maturation permease subunit